MKLFIAIFTDTDKSFISHGAFIAKFQWEVREYLEVRYKNSDIRIHSVIAVDELSPIEV